MEPTIATGYEKLAIDLEHFIKDYTPQGWLGPIKGYEFAPSFLPEEAEVLMIGYKIGALDNALSYLMKNRSSSKLGVWYIKSAIENFFQHELNESSVGK